MFVIARRRQSEGARPLPFVRPIGTDVISFQVVKLEKLVIMSRSDHRVVLQSFVSFGSFVSSGRLSRARASRERERACRRAQLSSLGKALRILKIVFAQGRDNKSEFHRITSLEPVLLRYEALYTWGERGDNEANESEIRNMRSTRGKRVRDKETKKRKREGWQAACVEHEARERGVTSPPC